MAKKKQISILWLIVAIALAGVSWYLKDKAEKEAETEKKELAENKGQASKKDKSGDKSSTHKAKPTVAKAKQNNVRSSVNKTQPAKPKTGSAEKKASGKSLLSPVRITSNKYDVLENCTLIPHRHNDGDSFHVRHDGKKTEFRLYFVDTPESKYKEYRDGNSNGKRISQQGNYFGGLDREQTTEVGKKAKKLVIELLSKQKFRVATQWENVYGPDRKYAFILVQHNGREVYLHELIVANGLGRIHTKPATMPDNTAGSRQRKKLKAIEAEAKKQKRGAWSY